MIIHITEKCIQNHGAQNRIDWALDLLRKEMEAQIKEHTQETFEIKCGFVVE